MKFARFATLALAVAALPLAGCSGGDTPTEAAEDANPTGLEVSDARLVLPAVSGNPGAIYMTVTNAGERNVAIRGTSVEGASSAQIHDTVESAGEMVMGEMGQVMVAAGESASFEPGGKHIMAFDLDPSLTAGGTTALTLTIVGGKTMTTDIAVIGAGDDR
ncbi:copper chaperone PCu(A)C [Qipengyuania sp. 6B39]|uniref:copper chaperone PCu(A)C n=1 Tax=Qipengyuania proteolytica TaxID=2867239 RepID=UPI001C8AF3EE|nr:copper chaperone PCu(A)C [Qipengyuania proteolytica]MBX7496085.1 copper chaperone PCu(A)C [Qipengyuania proteolytica]